MACRPQLWITCPRYPQAIAHPGRRKRASPQKSKETRQLGLRLGIMKRYGKLLSTPGVIPVVLAQLLARFPGGMLTIGLLIHYQKHFPLRRTHNYLHTFLKT